MNQNIEMPFAMRKKTSFTQDGAYAILTFEICDGGIVTFKVTYDFYTGHVMGKHHFDRDDMELLTREDAFCNALTSALGSLAYGGNTQSELYRKLVKKRFPKDSALRAVKHLKKNGYIDEISLADEEVSSCIAKGRGPLAIRSRLTTRGFGKKAFAYGLQLIEEVDFDEICLECARKKFTIAPKTYEEKQKAISALVRLGYTFDTAKRTVEQISEEE